jgi:hypothetical protein
MLKISPEFSSQALPLIVRTPCRSSEYWNTSEQLFAPQNIEHIAELSPKSGKGLFGQCVLAHVQGISPRYSYLACDVDTAVRALNAGNVGENKIPVWRLSDSHDVSELREKSVEILDLNVRIHNRLFSYGIDVIGQLMDMSDKDLLTLQTNESESLFTPASIAAMRMMISHTPPDAPLIVKSVPFCDKQVSMTSLSYAQIEEKRRGLEPR